MFGGQVVYQFLPRQEGRKNDEEWTKLRNEEGKEGIWKDENEKTI